MDKKEACEQLLCSIEEITDDFLQDSDANRMLLRLRTLVMVFIEQLVVSLIQQKLEQPGYLSDLKALASKMALRFKGFKTTSIRLLTGNSLSIRSPYFAKAQPKKRRGPRKKKRTPKNGCHLGLSHMGFLERCSAIAASSAIQAALLCPSLEIAHHMLSSFGMEMDVKTIRRLYKHIGDHAMGHRHQIALSESDICTDRTLLVCIDGGRLRERKTKRGRRPAEHKRQGYHTDWKEPTQLVIQWINADGTKCDDTIPIYDATMGNTDEAFDLLEAYLIEIECNQAAKVVFCGDGARRYWTRFQALANRLALTSYVEVIDYTHAKQNLNEILSKLSKNIGAKKRAGIIKPCHSLLWQGDISGLQQQIELHVKGSQKRKDALKKFKNYFKDNCQRMQYAALKSQRLPIGSGCVESAIRRVINLRLKSPGIFWKRDYAEAMLFLRSTLLCGRWEIMMNNLLALNREGC